jgi:hypothetical protein
LAAAVNHAHKRLAYVPMMMQKIEQESEHKFLAMP